MFARTIAPAILGLCAGVLLWLASRYHKAGRPGKALLDLFGALALIAAAIGMCS